MFNWIRAKVKNAIFAGINDAMEELEGLEVRSREQEGSDPRALLEQRLHLLPVQDAEPKRKGKSA